MTRRYLSCLCIAWFMLVHGRLEAAGRHIHAAYPVIQNALFFTLYNPSSKQQTVMVLVTGFGNVVFSPAVSGVICPGPDPRQQCYIDSPLTNNKYKIQPGKILYVGLNVGWTSTALEHGAALSIDVDEDDGYLIGTGSMADSVRGWDFQINGGRPF